MPCKHSPNMKKTYHLCLSGDDEVIFRDLEDYHMGFHNRHKTQTLKTTTQNNHSKRQPKTTTSNDHSKRQPNPNYETKSEHHNRHTSGIITSIVTQNLDFL